MLYSFPDLRLLAAFPVHLQGFSCQNTIAYFKNFFVFYFLFKFHVNLLFDQFHCFSLSEGCYFLTSYLLEACYLRTVTFHVEIRFWLAALVYFS